MASTSITILRISTFKRCCKSHAGYPLCKCL